MAIPIFPRWSQSIRFRLALTYALAVFTTGAVLIGGMYMWQVRQLDEPTLENAGLVLIRDGSGDLIAFPVSTAEAVDRLQMDRLELAADRAALDNLRKATGVGLSSLFVAAFTIGWFMAASSLRPINRMTRVAKEITGSDLSRRIALTGPDDEFKDLGDTFDAMLDRLQGAFEDHRRFVQDASHELRNPLAAARTNLELSLSDPGATVEDLRHSVEVAHRSTERMGVMIEQLLEQARIGMPQVPRSDVDLAAMATDVVGEFRAPARVRNLTLSLSMSSETEIDTDGDENAVFGGPKVRGDGPALRRALANLVSNAVRLAPEGSEIGIAVGQGDGCAILSVIDEGPGITVAQQQKVFKRFWRGEDSGPGTGLGLSIVRQIAERHGGVATVDSSIGVGSTFTVKLPMIDRTPVTKTPVERAELEAAPAPDFRPGP